MTWFRCGGGSGMPADLKNRMNAVFNKKFGTAVDYPAEGWPDNVNLMGPLPEGTVSGSIATLEDGADEVPIKSWEVEISPTLTGKSAIECTQTGKNLVDVSTATGTGTIWFNYDNGIELKKGVTYTFSCGNYGTGSIALYGIDHSTQVAYSYISASSAQVTYTPTENITVCPRIYQSGLTISNLVNVQLEVGSTVSTYAPYEAPTTATVSLGRTIYGGTAKVVKGTCEPFNLVSLNRSPQQAKRDYGITVNTQNENTLNITATGVAYACERLFYSLKSGMYAVKFQATSSDSYKPTISIYRTNGTGVKYSIQPNTLTTFTLADDADIDIRLFASGSGDSTVRTVEFTNFQIEKGSTVHDYSPYFEPFTFTPITPTPETALGVNNFWADEGDTTVVYRRDIDLALQAVSGSRGLMMATRPAIEPANGDQGSEESTENNIETEGDENAR